jgi:hypothetical protein
VIPFMKDKESPQELKYAFWMAELFPGIYPPANTKDPSYGFFKVPLSYIEGHIRKPKDSKNGQTTSSEG